MEQKQIVPKINDLVENSEIAFKNDQLKILLNQQPPAQWILKNKFANDCLYIPIDKVEYLMDALFQNWKVEVLDTKVLFNSISVNVRVHYIDPISGQWMFHDGVGAKELQTQKDTGVLKVDFSNVNKSAVEIALPIAKTNAIKDACDHLGKLFGRDLNRKTALEYNSPYKSLNTPKTEYSEIYLDVSKKLKEIDNLDDLGILFDSLYELEQKECKTLFTKRKIEIQNGINTK